MVKTKEGRVITLSDKKTIHNAGKVQLKKLSLRKLPAEIRALA